MTVNRRGKHLADMTPEQRKTVFTSGLETAPKAPNLVLRAGMKALCKNISDTEGLEADQAKKLAVEIRRWTRELERIEMTLAAVAEPEPKIKRVGGKIDSDRIRSRLRKNPPR